MELRRSSFSLWLWLALVIHNVSSSQATTSVPTAVAPTMEPTTSLSLEPSQKTTTLPTTTIGLTLNTSDAWASYWVKTIIKVGQTQDVTANTFRHSMEMELAQLLNEALERLNSILLGDYTPLRRRKRAVTHGNATVQVTNITRGYSEPSHTTLVYYLVEGGPQNNITTADRTVGLMELFSEQEVAIKLGYEVVLKAEVYEDPPPPKDKNLWIIGAVIGGIAGFIIIVWLIMFIYFKCTRPPTKVASPRNARTAKVADVDPLEYKSKDIKGFDYVRTEVGIENELDRQNVPDYYRRYPMGSGDFEGLYPGETPPPPFRGHRPSSVGKGSVKIEGDIVVKTAAESHTKPKPRSHDDTLSTGAEMDQTAENGSVDPKPQRKGQRRRNPKGSGKAGQVENVAKLGKMDDSISSDSPKRTKSRVKKPSSKSDELTDEDEENEVELALRKEAEIERRRIKQRQEKKKKRRPKSSADGEDRTRDDGESQPKPPRKKKRPKKKPEDLPRTDHIELQPIHDHHMIQPVIPGMQMQVPLGTLESDSDDGFDPVNGPESPEKDREMVNALLNEAFAMVSPTPTPAGTARSRTGSMSSRVQEPNQPAPMLPPELLGSRHTPLYVSPVSGYTGKLPGIYDPYEASDQAAQIEPPSRRRQGSHSSNRSGRSPRPPNTYTNPAYMNDLGSHTRSGSDINATSTPRSVTNIPNGFGPDSPRAFQPYEKPQWTNGWENEGTLPIGEKLNGSQSPRNPHDLSRYHILKPPSRDLNDDEVDIASDAMKTGKSAQPLIASIREEIERLAKRSQDPNSLRLPNS